MRSILFKKNNPCHLLRWTKLQPPDKDSRKRYRYADIQMKGRATVVVVEFEISFVWYGMFIVYPGSEFFRPGSRVNKILDPGSEFKYFNPNS